MIQQLNLWKTYQGGLISLSDSNKPTALEKKMLVDEAKASCKLDGETQSDYKPPELAKCDSCSHVQEAHLGFECVKCGEQTFTKKEEDELLEACSSKTKFVPLK